MFFDFDDVPRYLVAPRVLHGDCSLCHDAGFVLAFHGTTRTQTVHSEEAEGPCCEDTKFDCAANPGPCMQAKSIVQYDEKPGRRVFAQ